MTPEEQVKEIIKLLNPEEPETQKDAVFLVQRFKDDMMERLANKDKQIALVEAKLEEAQKIRLESTNECAKAKDEALKAKADLENTEARVEKRVREEIRLKEKGLLK